MYSFAKQVQAYNVSVTYIDLTKYNCKHDYFV